MTSSHGSPSSRTPDWADLTMHARRKRRVTAPAAGGWLGGGGGCFGGRQWWLLGVAVPNQIAVGCTGVVRGRGMSGLLCVTPAG